jgi:hypothetical protein
MTNPNIQIEQAPIQKRKKSANLEHLLQSKIVLDFSQKRPNERGKLFATFSETKNGTEGAIMTALGLVRGLSDLMYVDNGELVGIECKAPISSHLCSHILEQCNWLLTVPKRGYFCDSVEMFWSIINGGVGICPKKVIENIKNSKSKSLMWAELKK